MKSKVIVLEGQFENWQPNYLNELLEQPIGGAIGQKLVFEDEKLQLWSMVLQPGDRLPFHRHNTNYNWTCLSLEKAISRYENGKIKEITYHKGDLSYYNHETKGDLVHDLENIGDSALVFITVAYKIRKE